jgi:hypothetical protein
MEPTHSLDNHGAPNQALGKYLTRLFNGKHVSQRKSDGYINATEMGFAISKGIGLYNKIKRGKKMNDAIQAMLGTELKVNIYILLFVDKIYLYYDIIYVYL